MSIYTGTRTPPRAQRHTHMHEDNAINYCCTDRQTGISIAVHRVPLCPLPRCPETQITDPVEHSMAQTQPDRFRRLMKLRLQINPELRREPSVYFTVKISVAVHQRTRCGLHRNANKTLCQYRYADRSRSTARVWRHRTCSGRRVNGFIPQRGHLRSCRSA